MSRKRLKREFQFKPHGCVDWGNEKDGVFPEGKKTMVQWKAMQGNHGKRWNDYLKS